MPPRVEGQLSEALIQESEDGILGIDRVGCVRILNETAGRIFAIKPCEAIGLNVWDVLPKCEFSKALLSQIKESNPEPLQRLMLFPNERMFSVKMMAVRSARGRNLGAYASLRDVSGMQKIERGLDDVFTSLTREISIPLTTIKGFVETLLDGAYLDTQITRKFLQIINGEANNLVRLVMSLDSVTKEREIKPSMSCFRLEELIRECVATFEPIAASKHVTLTYRIADDLPWITADARLLRQVFINVLDNSVRFTGIKGGGSVEVDLSVQGREFIISIKDNGIGIETADLEHIFERFYRGRNSASANLGGAGLGLSAAESIIKSHGGTISASSIPGEGSVFTITLPVRLGEI
ncbi:MAG: ATP-binding protein [Candidatus Bruticola sp.]